MSKRMGVAIAVSAALTLTGASVDFTEAQTRSAQGDRDRGDRGGGGRDRGRPDLPSEPGDPAKVHAPAAEHIEQSELYDLVSAGEQHEAFELAFEVGDELFETEFNALDGVGAYVNERGRFTRVPRADLTGPGEWGTHFPLRETGPNAQACNACHIQLFDDGAGSAAANVHRDPTHSGRMSQFILRNTPHLFAPGALQRLAEEMTDELHAQRDRAAAAACAAGRAETVSLVSKGVSFGSLTATPTSAAPCEADFDASGVEGVDADLVVRPFQWKGNKATVRIFNRDASHNELGMQAVELVGDGVDGDSDGVVDEMSVGDMTALAVYIAAQPRPTTKLELEALGLFPRLTGEERSAILRGGQIFSRVGCDSCHKPALELDDPVFSEPSQNAAYREALFPAGQDPVSRLLDPDFAVTFDLTQDQPDNIIDLPGGRVYRLGSLRRDQRGRAIVELFGDLRFHEMGPELAEPIDETGIGASTWLTKELWGLGSTGPYLHDGRASTITEAIMAHGGEAEDERESFEDLPLRDMQSLVAFLENLVLFKSEEIAPE